MAALIRDEILGLQEATAWEEAEAEETEGRRQLGEIAERYEDVTRFLEEHE